ncbi:hypothetical protein [Rhizobium sp. NPDC092011]
MDARKRAKARLDKLRVEWQAADDQLGYSRAHQEELDVMHAELEAAQRLWEVPARTIAGVAAKLHSLVEWEDPGTTPGESPWPELRSILGDLVDIGELDGISEAADGVSARIAASASQEQPVYYGPQTGQSIRAIQKSAAEGA